MVIFLTCQWNVVEERKLKKTTGMHGNLSQCSWKRQQRMTFTYAVGSTVWVEPLWGFWFSFCINFIQPLPISNQDKSQTCQNSCSILSSKHSPYDFTGSICTSLKILERINLPYHLQAITFFSSSQSNKIV